MLVSWSNLKKAFLFAPIALLLSPGAGLAQSGSTEAYPQRAIRLVVPFPPGGGTDTVARLIGKELNDKWGKPVVIDNRSGGNGIIALQEVVRASPDGHTLVIGVAAMTQYQSLYKKLPFDPFKDFTPISQVALTPNLLLVPANSPANSVPEFVELVRGNPGKYTIGSFGNATTGHLHAALFKRQANLDLIHVPYRGSAPLVQDLMGGQIPAGFVDTGSARGHLKSGKYKVLAVTGTQRDKAIPNVPTMSELGYQNFEPYGFFGVYSPAGTPKSIVDKLAAEIAQIVKMPEVRSRLEEMGLLPLGNSPEEFARSMKRDAEIWAKIISAENITAD